MKLRFLGANRQVTGSRYGLEAGGLHLLIDCGLFQERPYLERNWDPCPIDPARIDFLLLTHAHLDHCGLIPKLVREGFSRPILTTAASAELARIVMLDAARIQEEDAAFKKKRHQEEGRQGPRPVLPLYTQADAEAALPLLQSVQYHEELALNDQVTAVFHDAGHILGSSALEVRVRENGQERSLVFSGDVGQWDKPIIRDPEPFAHADYLILESTYGDRDHLAQGNVEDLLAEAVNEATAAGGNLVIPTFAIERAQELMFHLSRLVRQQRIRRLMVFLDSPMAIDATEVFLRHGECLDEETVRMMRQHESPFRFPGMTLVRRVEQSKAINHIQGSCIIMSASGMCTAGRIKHHLVHNISRPQNTILFVGYQAHGTLGRQILEGAAEVRIHGRSWPVKARVRQISGFSAHADRAGLLRWSGSLSRAPQRVFVTHGEESASQSLANDLRQARGWDVAVPEYGQTVDLA